MHTFPRPLPLALLALATAGRVALAQSPGRAPGEASTVRDSRWNTAAAVLPRDDAPTSTTLRLVRGIATRPDLVQRDGTIEFDLAPPDGLGTQFVGVAFRVASSADYELVELVSNADGTRWSGVQYQPVLEGESTWQLYAGPAYVADVPRRGDVRMPRPLHVRLAVSGTRADVYLDGATEPVLRIPELKRAPAAGPVGVWASSPDGAAAAVEHLAVHGDVGAPLAPVPAVAAPEGQLLRWRVSGRLSSPDGVTPPPALGPTAEEALRAGVVATAESDGLVSLTRWVGNPAGPQRTYAPGGAGWGLALARVVLVADRAQTARLHFGYSDGVAIFVNGESAYVGRNDADSRYPGYLGTLSRDADAVDLRLRKGRNVLTLAVTDRAYGWGFAARLEQTGGVRVEVP